MSFSAALGDIIIVDDDGFADFDNIQAAIDDSNDGDIVYVFPGVYTGEGNRDIDFVGKAITVQSVDPDDPYIVAWTIIDCNGSAEEPHRGFYFHYGEDANSLVAGLTITNGYRTNGAGIYCYQSSPTISKCVISNGRGSSNGKGIYGNGSDLVISECVISGNDSSGISLLECSATVMGCIISNNYRGIYLADGNSTVRECEISNNTDGGILLGDSNSTVTDCNISNNRTGIDCYRGSPTISQCVIRGNGDEGGIYAEESSLVISDCVITGNSGTERGSYGYGGGIYLNLCSATVTGCDIINNTARYGGGINCYDDWNIGTGSIIIDCNIIGNYAEDDGGGGELYARRGISRCVIMGNRCGYMGGGVHVFLGIGTFTISDCLINSNYAGIDGGGIYRHWFADYLKLKIQNCTIASNIAYSYYGGGIYSMSPFYIYFTNSIIWGNRDSRGIGLSSQIEGYQYFDFSYSCIMDGTPGDSNLPLSEDNIDSDPMFVREPNDGGDGWGDDPDTNDVDEGANDDYGDLHLRSDSPCIDVGDPNYSWWANEKDIDGQHRVMGERVDIGADEFLVPFVSVSKPEGSEVWAAGSLHEILWESYYLSGDVDVCFSSNNGGDWTVLDTNIVDTNSYMWQLASGIDSNECLIKVTPSVADPNVVVIDSGLFEIHPDSPGVDVDSVWESLGGDYSRRGLSDTAGPELGCVKWEVDFNEAVGSVVTIGVDDRVHIGCEDGKVFTVDSNGILLWSCDTNSVLVSAPSIGVDGTVYIGSTEGRVFAIDIDGGIRWTHSTGGAIYSSPAVSVDGNSVYVCSADGVLYALGRDGSELWEFETGGYTGAVGGAILTSPAVDANGTVYFTGYNDSNLYAVDGNDGSLKWVCHFDSGGWGLASPVVGPEGRIYQVLLYDPNLYAVDSNDGSIIWSLSLGEVASTNDDIDGLTEPVVGPDGTIYLNFDKVYRLMIPGYYVDLPEPYLFAIDPNGSSKWFRHLGRYGSFRLTVGPDGFVYAAGDDGWLLVYDSDGFELSRFEGPMGLVGLAHSAISSDGTVIVSSGDKVFAVSEEACDGQLYDLHWPEDLYGDGIVNFRDFALYASEMFKCTSNAPWYYDYGYYIEYVPGKVYLPGDLNRDYCVDCFDFSDLKILVDRWLRTE